MQYCQQSLTTKVNLDVPIHGINDGCLKFIPKRKNKKKQKLVIGNRKGFIYMFRNSKQLWSSISWQEVNQKLPDDEKSIKSLQICKVLKSTKNKRDRILYSDGKYLKCLNKGNLLQSDNKDLDKDYGDIKVAFGDDDYLILQSQKNNSLIKINYKKNSNWLSYSNQLKLKQLYHKPYINQISNVDYDYESKNLVFSSLSCIFITNSELNATAGIGHSSNLSRVKVFDMRKDRFNSFQIMPPPQQQQQNNNQQGQFMQLVPIQSIIAESSQTNELMLGTFFKNQYAQIDQIITTTEKGTCFGYGDIFKMDKSHILCGYKGGYSLFQENLNRIYEPLDISAQNVLLNEIPTICEYGDFQDDMFHQGIGEFILSSQNGSMVSVSPLPNYKFDLNGRSHTLNQFIAYKKQDYQQNIINQQNNPNNNSFSQGSAQQLDYPQSQKVRSASMQPTQQELNSPQPNNNTNTSNNNQQSQLQSQINDKKQNKQQQNDEQQSLNNPQSNKQGDKQSDEAQKNNTLQQSTIPPKPFSRHKHNLETRFAKNDSQNKINKPMKELLFNREANGSISQPSTTDKNNESDRNGSLIDQNQESKIEEQKEPNGFPLSFRPSLQSNKKFQLVDNDMDEIEKQFQAALSKNKQSPFILSKNNNPKEISNSKMSTLVFQNKNQIANFKGINNGMPSQINNEQRTEIVEKLIKKTQNNQFFNPDELLKITEKSPKKVNKNQKEDEEELGSPQRLVQKESSKNTDSEIEISPSIRDTATRGRLRRPSFNRMRESNHYDDDNQQQMSDYLNSSILGNDNNIGSSPFKLRQAIDSQRGERTGKNDQLLKSNIQQNLEKELQKNQINMNPIEQIMYKSTTEIPAHGGSATKVTQRQQKLKEEQMQRNQQQMVQRRKRISSDFQQFSQDDSDYQQNYAVQIAYSKDNKGSVLEKNENENNTSQNSPLKQYPRQPSIDNFYNKEKHHADRPKSRMHNNNQDLSLYNQLEDIQQQRDFSVTQQTFYNNISHNNHNNSKDDLTQPPPYGLSYKKSEDDLHFKQIDPNTFNKEFNKEQTQNNNQKHVGYLSSLQNKQDSYDFYYEEETIPLPKKKPEINFQNSFNQDQQTNSKYNNNHQIPDSNKNQMKFEQSLGKNYQNEDNNNQHNNSNNYLQKQPTKNNFFVSEVQEVVDKSSSKEINQNIQQKQSKEHNQQINGNYQISKKNTQNQRQNEDIFEIYGDDNQTFNKPSKNEKTKPNENSQKFKVDTLKEGKGLDYGSREVTLEQRQNNGVQQSKVNNNNNNSAKQSLENQLKISISKKDNKFDIDGMSSELSAREQYPSNIQKKLSINNYNNNNNTSVNNKMGGLGFSSNINPKSRYVINSPTEDSSKQSKILFKKQPDVIKTSSWRSKIPSRDFLDDINTDVNSSSFKPKQNYFYQPDSDEFSEVEIYDKSGYVLEQIKQRASNYQKQNQSKDQFQWIKKYNPIYTQFQDDFNDISQNVLKRKDGIIKLQQTKPNTLKLNKLINSMELEISDVDDDNENFEIKQLEKDIEKLQNQMNEIQLLNNDSLNFGDVDVVTQPSLNYSKEVLFNQNRIRYKLVSQFKIKSIFILLKTPRSVEITKPINMKQQNMNDDKENNQIEELNNSDLQIIKCQGGSEDFKFPAFEIIILEQTQGTVYFDLLYNEDGFSVELVVQTKFEYFDDNCYEFHDKNKAFVFFQSVYEAQSLEDNSENVNQYHSLKLNGVQKNQLLNIYNSLFSLQIPENLSKRDEFVMKTVNNIFGLNIILHYYRNSIAFYSQSLTYIKSMQNRITSRFDEKVQKIQCDIKTSNIAYIYHFDKIFSLVKQRKDIREQQLIIVPIQEIVEISGISNLSKHYVKLLSQKNELNEIYQQTNDFDEICRMQLENIIKCVLSITPALKSSFEKQRDQIDNLIFNLRVKSIYTKLFPLENASFVGN